MIQDAFLRVVTYGQLKSGAALRLSQASQWAELQAAEVGWFFDGTEM